MLADAAAAGPIDILVNNDPIYPPDTTLATDDRVTRSSHCREPESPFLGLRKARSEELEVIVPGFSNNNCLFYFDGRRSYSRI